MAGGLAALLDDVAVLARMAAASADDVAAAAGRGWLEERDGRILPTALGGRFGNDVIQLFMDEDGD